MGRKKIELHKRKDKVYQLRLTKDQEKQLETLSEYTGESRADILRYGLELAWERFFALQK